MQLTTNIIIIIIIYIYIHINLFINLLDQATQDIQSLLVFVPVQL